MPLIRDDENYADLEDKTISKEGEYPLRIIKGEYKATKAGDNHMIVATLSVEGEEGEGVAPFQHYMTVPSADGKGQYDRMRKRDLVRFLVKFGVDPKAFDPEEDAPQLAGLTATVLVKLEKGDDDEFYPRLRLPRIA
jgi:hypothetical protein